LTLSLFTVSSFAMNLKQLVVTAREALAAAGLDSLPDGRTSPHLDERVVRFLRQAGVVSPPEGHGPGAVWSELHCEQILTCRALQMAGESLGEVKERVRGKNHHALQALRSQVLETLQTPMPQESAKRCPSWRIGEDFILVSPSGRNVSPAILTQITKLLHTLSK